MVVNNKKIIIIEDDDFISRALKIKLEDKGINILIAKDGKTGLDIVKKEKPDLVLLDLILPKMSGYDVLVELKKDIVTKKIPVIILTNLNQNEVEKKVKDFGAIDCLVKANISLEQIFKRISEVFK
ncbi:MAG: hypothetical protein A2725_00720 [Candidatus Magasanikbacteria bacterium RIFCSPHIGHO2_01_FULL_33_34]|uniref:Response regulatory domain-containing protein n=1 Tax=Candidatus Magasanikbacteria bacterium RIFCSPHIGHO2_01_FULL_33_34 TaxID=1798671 RepID=A0A1F6LIX1_9BACT|nr:MAG: hypothetical protein A2725_00720 [Candidatus Magasanikbacteria bacterium RIFCSPHIGHO2_01_FULL_33_34]OGH65284.1 MAG: hypothetical protein A3B83_04380 [Candidatus Magasanikbacteria bacterium RIFCSPHIGHO2_02_FULL_33_17]OGH76061.1 MAG: hypothetical protein A3A89_01305 [Candidatus Magasanikbacteria bacterium RIFCSPLOWO2_01_FULL_33_34]OGH81768.1 MAG: hypothetical protein A3F93_00855 [Candidatus Magasanikbacteria bacterium RIFCSPLOWO2_12_FULL_34_7]